MNPLVSATASDANTTALVLAGGSLAGKNIGPTQPLNLDPAALADGSGLALDHIVNRLLSQNLIGPIQVVVDAPKPHDRPWRYQRQWQWLPIPPQTSILASLEAALHAVSTPQVLVHPITTLPPDQLPHGCWIGVSDKTLLQEDWSAVSEPASRKPRFWPKQHAGNDLNARHAFTGLIAAPTALLQELLSKRWNNKDWNEIHDHDLLNLAELLWLQGNASLKLIPWLDLGHRATASQRRLHRLTSRGFNSVTYCPAGDLIRKCSNHDNRLNQEAAYYQALPHALQRFFPACVMADADTTRTQAKRILELEYVPFPSLAEHFLHWRIGANAWQQLFRRLDTVLDALAQAPESQPFPVASPSWLYSNKLRHRLAELEAAPPELPHPYSWAPWWTQPWCLEIVGSGASKCQKPLHLPAPMQAASTLLQHLVQLESPQTLQRIHGDLCFNNILAEPLSGSIRLIDPRGERPKGAHWPVGYGDSRYDLVKLLHSGRYLYDAVVNDRFELDLPHLGHLRLHLDVPSHYREVNQAMDEQILKGKLSRDEERLLTASLFFSMLPLHREDGERCLVFTAIGQMILQQCFDSVLLSAGEAAIGR